MPPRTISSAKDFGAADPRNGNRDNDHREGCGTASNFGYATAELWEQDIDTIAEVLRESIEATMDDLTREGLWRG